PPAQSLFHPVPVSVCEKLRLPAIANGDRHEVEIVGIRAHVVIPGFHEELAVTGRKVVSEARVEPVLRGGVAPLDDGAGAHAAGNAPPPVPRIADRREIDELRIGHRRIDEVGGDAAYDIEAAVTVAGTPDGVHRDLPDLHVAVIDLPSVLWVLLDGFVDGVDRFAGKIELGPGHLALDADRPVRRPV